MPDADPVRIVFGDEMSVADAAALAHAAQASPIEIFFDVEDVPSETIAEFVDHVDGWLRTGRLVRLHDTPQMLAHTLYKVGRLGQSRFLTVTVRGTEPYAG
jgi:hypothetical protein